MSVRCERITTQGKLDKAEMLKKEALAIHKKAFGSEHLAVANSLNSLAGLYQAQASSALLMRCCPLRRLFAVCIACGA